MDNSLVSYTLKIAESEGRVAAYFPDDFTKYVDTQLNCRPVVQNRDDGEFIFAGWVFWSREDDQSEHPQNIFDFKDKIKDVLQRCLPYWFRYPTLFQFWAPTMTMEARSYLTTQNQPFAFCTLDDDDVEGPVKGLCGVVGLEFSRSDADHVKERNVKRSEALDEINKVLEVVSEVHGLHFAQVWAPCRVDWRCRALVKGGIFHVILKFDEVICRKLIGMANVEQHLRKGQGCFMLPSNKDDYEISFQNGEKLDSVQMSQTTKSLPRLEPLQSRGEMTQLDLSSQQSMDALNNESNVVSAERSNIDVTCSQEKDNLQVSRSTLKRVCRGYGFPRWPPRKKKMVGSSQPSESSLGVHHQQIPQLSSDQAFSQASAAVVHANPSNTVIRDANIVTVKAKYINDIIIKFPLSLSSGLVELQQQIANRLHLEDETYYVKYKDEVDDLIVIACDQDLQDCISTCRLLGTSVVVLLEPKSITIDQMMTSFEETLLFE
ncbi:unnamed protein product [Camellia sinensis]